jgi:hypothetical protein
MAMGVPSGDPQYFFSNFKPCEGICLSFTIFKKFPLFFKLLFN